MRWSSESGKKTCSQVDASTEAGFMHSYVVGHIGLDPSQPSILRNGDRGRRESSRQVPVRLFGLSVLSRGAIYHREHDPYAVIKQQRLVAFSGTLPLLA